MAHDITKEELTCLRVYADVNGRKWKAQLRQDWQRDTCVPQLRSLRNSHGPSWLVRFKFPKD